MTASAMTALVALRDACSTVPGVQTCRIGLEAAMTPADYPIVRIVPSAVRSAAVTGRRRSSVLVYFGKPIHEFEDGLESLYAELFALEALLIDVIESTPGVIGIYQETIADEDRFEGYKLMAIRAEVEG